MTQKQSIQLFEERNVRTIWDDVQEKWYFSVVDVIAILTDSPTPRNYWKVLKNRLKKEGNESVTNCNQLKLLAADGKRYLSDVADQEQLFRIIQSVPSPLVGGGFFIASKLSTERRSVNSFFARKIFAILKYNFKFANFFLHNFMKNTFKIQIISLFSCVYQ
jgi:hypothetical protein